MITPRRTKSPPNQAGDIYYSTVLRFVKRFREDFSNFLRSGIRTHPSGFHRQLVCFEENTGSKSNRYHIIYTQIPPLSSPKQKKYRKKSATRAYVCTRINMCVCSKTNRIRHMRLIQHRPAHARNVLEGDSPEQMVQSSSTQAQKQGFTGWRKRRAPSRKNRARGYAVQCKLTTPRWYTRRSRCRAHSTPDAYHSTCRPGDRHCTGSWRNPKRNVF